MFSHRLAGAALLAVLATATSACDALPGAEPEATDQPTTSPSPSPTTAPSPTEEPPVPAEPATMQELFDETRDEIVAYAENQGLTTPATWNFVPVGETIPTQCTDGGSDLVAADDQAFFYCGGDDGVYVGEAVMQLFVDEFGTAAPSLGIAHEWGHHLQRTAGVESVDQATYISKENQADCVSGAWFRDDATSDGTSLGQVARLGALLAAISEQESPERTHGTLLERETSAIVGATTGLASCNEYFPETPLS